MLLHLPIAILATLSPIAVSLTVPKFDTVRECSFEGGPSVDVARCARDEAGALRQLEEVWAQYAGSDRKACTTEATIGGFATYVELLTCLEMARDVKIADNNTRGPGAHQGLDPGSCSHSHNRSPTLNKESHHVPALSPESRIRRRPVRPSLCPDQEGYLAAIGAHGPAALKSVLAADAVLAAGTLTKRDQEIIKLVISAAGGCDYYMATKLAGVKPEMLKQGRNGEPTRDAKRDALVSFVRKLAQSSGTVSDEDFAAIKAEGYSDTQLVEISLAFATTAFTNVFNRINDAEIDFPAVA